MTPHKFVGLHGNNCEGNILHEKTWIDIITSFNAHVHRQISHDLSTSQAAEDAIRLLIRKNCLLCLHLMSFHVSKMYTCTWFNRIWVVIFFPSSFPFSFVSKMSPVSIFTWLTQFHLNANVSRREEASVSKWKRINCRQWSQTLELFLLYSSLSLSLPSEHQKQRIHWVCVRVATEQWTDREREREDRFSLALGSRRWSNEKVHRERREETK